MYWGKGKLIFGCFVAIFFACWLFLFSEKTKAAEPSGLLINEIFPNPNYGENEWIEIFNSTKEDLSLSGYSIEDGSHSPKFLSGTVKSQEYFIIEKNVEGFSFGLNNDKEIILLKKTGVIIDSLAYGHWNDDGANPDDNAPAPAKGKSLSRIPNGSDTDIGLIDFRVMAPSKNLENILPVYSDLIIINEIMPQPSTSSKDEFIELYNSGSSDIDLSGWQIDDVENGGSIAFGIPDGTIIKSMSYLPFYNSDTGICLNDTGDAVRLVDPNSEEKDKVNYTSAKRGQSYSLFSDWQWTLSTTPNLSNVLTLETEEPNAEVQIIETDITGAKDQADETIVSIAGIVTVSPGKLSSQYFYIQDQNSGIQIYNSKKEFPSLNLGDEVKVIGELDTISGERRIKTLTANDIIILSSHPPPEPEKASIEQVGENLAGKYIGFTGTVVKTSGTTFYLKSNVDVAIIIRKGTGIKKPRMKVGDKVYIAGIVSQYNDSYRILPIKQSDVKIISSSRLADTGPNFLISLISAFCFTIILWSIQARVFLIRKT